MGEVKKTWKHYIAFIKFRGRTHRMPVSGVNEKSVMKEVTDFYVDFFEAEKDSGRFITGIVITYDEIVVFNEKKHFLK